jgi:hypothetical protein
VAAQSCTPYSNLFYCETLFSFSAKDLHFGLDQNEFACTAKMTLSYIYDTSSGNYRYYSDRLPEFLSVPGVDVTITIFGEKMAFFSKTNVMINILHNLALFKVKNAIFFAEIFGENI